MEEVTGSKEGKEYNNAVYCYSVYLTYMQNISCIIPGLINHKLESRFLGERATTSDKKIISL